MRKRYFSVLLLGFLFVLLLMAGGPSFVMAQDGGSDAVLLKMFSWQNSAFPSSAMLPQKDWGLIESDENVISLPDHLSGGLWNQIVFQSFRDGNWEIYMMDRDGNNQRRLTYHDASDIHPRLRPDLQQVVFVSYRDGRPQIYKMNSDGSHVVRLSDLDWDDANPVWSPNGSQIAFSRKKNGHWGLFIMNADGSSLRRLTRTNDADDISPTWSPDGSKIAWIRRKDGGYGDVMIMDVYGNNQRTFRHNLRFVQNLSWSPDGQRLAADYDYNGDYWNDLMILEMNGIDSAVYLSPGGLTDLWLGSWSPDSRYLLFSWVKYIVHDNNLYITESHLKKIGAHQAAYNMIDIPGSQIDMAPDWQRGYDTQRPTASIQSLPAISPSPVQLRWSGVDEGSSGISYYQIQVRVDDGDWQDWLAHTVETSGAYPGVGGHHYAFRVRARDAAGNRSAWTADDAAITTVENQPPHSQFTRLPRYLRSGDSIAWQGQDAGGSGIKFYDVQYREAQSDQWVDLRRQTTDTRASFSAYNFEPAYFFRVRATDHADNQETWDNVGQGPLEMYRWGVSGKVLDNRNRPLAGAQIKSHPESWLAEASDEDGDYRLFVREMATKYTVKWLFSGLTSPPATNYDADWDAHADVVMRPADDVIQDGAAEEQSIPSWDKNGRYPPHVINTSHTGRQAIRLGVQFSSDHVQRIETPYDAYHFTFQRDGQNNLHLLWDDRRGFSDYILKYARIDATGAVTEVRDIEAYGYNGGYHSMAVASDGTVYIVWLSPQVDYHYQLLRRSSDGQWSQPQKLELGRGAITAAVDRRGILHLYERSGLYQQCTSAGVCSSPEKTGVPGDSYYGQIMTVAPDGAAYFAWVFDGDYNQPARLFYRIRHPDGYWDAAQQVPGFSDMAIMEDDPFLNVDNLGVMHFLLRGASKDEQGEYHNVEIYTRSEPNGGWSQKRFPEGFYRLFVQPDGRVHVIGVLGSYDKLSFRYARQTPNGNWDIDEITDIPPSVAKQVFYADRYNFAVDSQGRVYAAAYGSKIHAAVRDIDNRWRFLSPFGRACEVFVYYEQERAPHLLVDGNDILRLAWPGDSPHCDPFILTNSLSLPGDSLLQQQVHIPAEMQEPTLSFFYRFQRLSHAHTQFHVGVATDEQSTSLLTIDENTLEWSHQWIDMTAWKGQTITVTFNIPQTAGMPTAWGDVDDISLGTGAYADLWVVVPAVSPQPDDATMTLGIRYGNRGDVSASGARITFTLPPHVDFVTSNPPPSGREGDRVWWDVAKLPAGARPTPFMVTMTMPPDAVAGDILSGQVVIVSDANELFESNNETEALVFVSGGQLHLPLFLR